MPITGTTASIGILACNKEPSSHKKYKTRLLDELQECINSRDLTRGRLLHKNATSVGLPIHSDSHLSSRLVKMYSKCGSMEEARLVFDRVASPSLIAWNVLIKGYADNGDSETAFRLAQAMESQDLKPNTWTFVALLKACVISAQKQDDGKKNLLKENSLEKCRELHSQIQKIGCETDLFVANTLMDAFSNCGSLIDCRSVFEKMPVHDVVTWNTLILGHAENGEEETALQIFQRMILEPRAVCNPDSRTFVAVLKACTGIACRENDDCKLLQLERSMAVHLEAERRGFCGDIFVSSCLIDLYSKCGSMSDARRVFERMESRNVVTWTALLTGYADNGDEELVFSLFELMQGQCDVNARTLLAVLKACSGAASSETSRNVGGELLKLVSLERVLSLDSFAQRRNWKSNLVLENSFVDLYAKCGSMADSERVFDRIEQPDIVSWNSLLQGFVENGEPELALQMFCKVGVACEPDERTLVAALKACSSMAMKEEVLETDSSTVKPGALELGMAIHSRYLVATTDIFVANTLMDTYFKCGSAADARRVFDSMPRRNLISWTVAILGHAENGEGEAGLELFLRFRTEEAMASQDSGLFIAALKACNAVSVLEYGKAIHSEACRHGLERVPNVAGSLVDFYGKCGAMVAAEQVFDNMKRRDVVAWTSLLTGFSRQGDTRKTLELFDEMKANEVEPVGVTFLALLTACSHAGLVDKGRELFEAMRSEFGVEPEIDHYHCLVDLLGRANRVESALEVVRGMPFRASSVTWTTLLDACRKAGNRAAIETLGFEEVLLSLDNEQAASAAAYVLLSNVCASSLSYKCF